MLVRWGNWSSWRIKDLPKLLSWDLNPGLSNLKACSLLAESWTCLASPKVLSSPQESYGKGTRKGQAHKCPEKEPKIQRGAGVSCKPSHTQNIKLCRSEGCETWCVRQPGTKGFLFFTWFQFTNIYKQTPKVWRAGRVVCCCSISKSVFPKPLWTQKSIHGCGEELHSISQSLKHLPKAGKMIIVPLLELVCVLTARAAEDGALALLCH